jgi:hypothetical protein
MKHIRACTSLGLAAAAMLLSPAVLIIGIPLAIGIGLDIVEIAGETPFVLALCIPLVIVLLRRFAAGVALRRAVARLWSRLHLHSAADLIHAP